MTPFPSFPPKLFSTISSSVRTKYMRLYLSTVAWSPGGLTTRWLLECKTPFENVPSASPMLTITWPGSGRTYSHSSWSGRHTCRPPILLNRIVMEPKSVVPLALSYGHPRAEEGHEEGESGCQRVFRGGAEMTVRQEQALDVLRAA